MLRIIAEIRVDRILQIANRMDLATNRYIGASDTQAALQVIAKVTLNKLHKPPYTTLERAKIASK